MCMNFTMQKKFIIKNFSTVMKVLALKKEIRLSIVEFEL